MKKHILLSLVIATLGAGTSVQGSGVSWSSGFNQTFIDSHGNPLDSLFAFELGTFSSGFVPTSSNLDQWAANWQLLSRADTTNTHWVPDDPIFGAFYDNGFSFNSSGQVNGLAGSDVFVTGEQAYVWVFSNNEWALVTDNSPGVDENDIWRLPNPADISGFPLNWELQNADTAVFGAVNPVSNAFRLQTAVIPEPGTSLLVLMIGGLLQLTRHHRRRQS
jgi:hypothetical protein